MRTSNLSNVGFRFAFQIVISRLHPVKALPGKQPLVFFRQLVLTECYLEKGVKGGGSKSYSIQEKLSVANLLLQFLLALS